MALWNYSWFCNKPVEKMYLNVSNGCGIWPGSIYHARTKSLYLNLKLLSVCPSSPSHMPLSSLIFFLYPLVNLLCKMYKYQKLCIWFQRNLHTKQFKWRSFRLKVNLTQYDGKDIPVHKVWKANKIFRGKGVCNG